MFDLLSAAHATDRDFTAIIDQLHELDPADWNRDVRCAGWTVRELARHVVSASRGQAEGLRRAVVGELELARLDAPSEQSPSQLLAALRTGHDTLMTALGELSGPAMDGLVPLPFGPLPAPVALQIIALEYGFHRNDLSWALEQLEPLGPDIATTLLEITPGLLSMLSVGTPVRLAGQSPDQPVDYLLRAADSALRASYRQGWTFSDESDLLADTCVISGDNSAIALFIMGRITSTDPNLTVNDQSQAAMFKRYFPGP